MSQSKYESLVFKYADQYGIPRDIAIKQVKQESSFNPNAVSGAGAAGLMQLMEPTAKDLGLTGADRFDPEKNVEAGMRYMAQLKKRYKGDMALTLAAYNAGMGNVDKHNGIPPFRETQEYVQKILGTVPGTVERSPQRVPTRTVPVQELAEPGLTPLQKKLAARQRLDEVNLTDTDTTVPDPRTNAVVTAGKIADDANDMAMAGRDAGTTNFGEALADGFRENVTGALIDEYLAGEPDQAFIAGVREGKYNEVLDVQPWQADTNARNYVLASRNQEDFERRMSQVSERAEFAQRMNNTNGWAGIGAVGAQFLGQMLDPVAVGISFGTGVAANTALRGAAIAATENIAMGIAIDMQQRREITPDSLLLNGMLGGALGGVGGTFAARADSKRLLAQELALAEAAARQADELAVRVEAETKFTDNPQKAWEDVMEDLEMPPIPRMFDDDMSPVPVQTAEEFISNIRVEIVDAVTPLYSGMFDIGDFGAFTDIRPVELPTPLAPMAEVPFDTPVVVRTGSDAEQLALTDYPAIPEMPSRDLQGTNQGAMLPTPENFSKALEVTSRSNDPVNARLATKLQTALDDVNVVLNDMTDPQIQATSQLHGIAGRAYYDGVSDAARVFARPDEVGRIAERTLLHEATHVATLGATILRDKVRTGQILPGKLTPNQVKAVRAADRLDAIMRRYKTALGKRADNVYGFTNLDEFVAEIANPEFRRLLASVDGPQATGIRALLQDLKEKLKEWLGIPKTEKAPDYIESVFELIDASGNLRKADDIPVWNPDFSFGGAFSRNLIDNPNDPTNPVVAEQLRASARRAKFDSKVEAWDDKITDTDAARRTAQKTWYEMRRPGVVNANEKYLDSPGLIAQNSKSKVVRYWGAHIMEDAPGRGKRVNDTAAIEAAKLQLKWQHQYIPAVRSEIVNMMSLPERIAYALGSTSAQSRISREIALERLARREATKAGTTYKSGAPEPIQRAADQLDAFYEDALNTGKANGVERAAAAMNTPGGHTGYMPYQWNWQEINRVFREDPAAWNALVNNMKGQYRDKLVGRIITDMEAKGAYSAEDLAEALSRVNERVDHLVSVKLQKLMADPETRVMGNDIHIAGIAEELLLENFQGGRVTERMAADFKEQLAEIMEDFSRTEMDLLTEVDGVRLVDYVNHDALQLVEREARSLSGLTGLARKGVYEQADVAAILESARADGATPVEIEALAFGFRSLGLGNLKSGKEHAFATALRDGAHMALMGKLGFSILAELPGAMAQLGIGAVLRSFPMSFYRSPIMRQIAEVNPAMSGLQHRINTLSQVDIGARGMDTSSQFLNLLRRGRQMTDWLSLANPISIGIHNAVVPTIINQMLLGVRKRGGLTAQQLDDAGLSPELAELVRREVELHDPNYKQGQELNLEKWDTYVADQFLLAAHRVTDNIMTRAKVGERPMWQVESDLGALAGQFRGAGYLAAEKHLVRAASTNEAGRMALLGAVSLTFGTMLYEARMFTSTLGMSEKEAAEYMEKRREPGSYAAGVAVLTNMSGLLPEGVNIVNLITGNTPQGSNFVAGFGFLDSAFQAMSAPIDLAAGDTEKGVKKIMRIMPGGNSIPMQTILNSMTAED